ncbi:MAG: Gfo/Idh/MocA family protein [Planctomycetota bacterium]|jgi:predicted dehydrogenase
MQKHTRRDFMMRSTLAGAGLCLAGGAGCRLFQPLPEPRYRSPNEKLNIACIGVGGRGRDNVRSVSSENIVALCDVDDQMAEVIYQEFPDAKKYRDFRKMFDELHSTIDAVVISTPDHMHALPAMIAMQYGMHVYCEKPLTHDVHEARLLRETARRYGVATQMGNQGTANDHFRAGVEALRAGVLGKVTEVHVWTNRPVWPQGMDRPKESPPVPAHLDWDLWLGTAPDRPYNPAYHPFKWRGWWDFGTGALGDMACHTANLAFMGLNLGYPISVESKNSAFSKDSFPTWSVITLEFPKRGDAPPLTWTWYDGAGDKPAWVIEKLKMLTQGGKVSGSGLVIVGEKGSLFSPDDYGKETKLLPLENFADFEPPAPSLPRSPGHHHEWIDACKGGPKALSDFSYAGPFTETVLLGNLAMYTGKKILWDGEGCRATNCDEANALVRREYRKGWSY